MKNWNQSWKVGIALFIKQQKHLNQLCWKLWQTAQNILYYRHILSYPLGPINDNKEPSCGICRVTPCETLTNRILHKCTKSNRRYAQDKTSPIPQNTWLPWYWWKQAFISVLKQEKEFFVQWKACQWILLLSSPCFL